MRPNRGYSEPCVCGASDCPRCYPNSYNECDECGGTGIITCDCCPHDSEKDEEGECPFRDNEGCPVCPTCGGVTAEDEAENAAEARAEARKDREWDRDYDRDWGCDDDGY